MINYKLWRFNFYHNVSAKDRVQDNNRNQSKFKVNDSYEEDEKYKTNFEASNPKDVINKPYLDTKRWKLKGHIAYIQTDQNEFKLLSDKQSVEEVLIQRAFKMTIQILYDKGLFDNYNNADEVLSKFLFIERRRPD